MMVNAPASRRKILQILLILATACITLLAASFLYWNPSELKTLPPVFAEPIAAPDPLPEAELVFGGVTKLGFLNADGSSETLYPFIIPRKTSGSSWGRPFVTGDNQWVVVSDRPYPAAGYIYIARAGKTAVDCGWYGIARLAVDGRHLWIETDKGQEQYLPEDCGTGKAPEKVYEGVLGAVSPDEQYSARAAELNEKVNHRSTIVIQQIGTEMEKPVGEGDFPAWSRDGQWLAYTGTDGIYIVQNSPNAEPRRLVALASPDPLGGVSVYGGYLPGRYFPPHPSWSPDGQWLVYHLYQDAHTSIFKVNVHTGETMKLLEEGYSPSWRWPVQEP